jgi:DNA-binding XRE family transcriptional regulator
MEQMVVEPSKIREARVKAGHTQEQAAHTVGVARRTWQDWERGIAAMMPGLFELYLIKTGQHPELRLITYD